MNTSPSPAKSRPSTARTPYRPPTRSGPKMARLRREHHRMLGNGNAPARQSWTAPSSRSVKPAPSSRPASSSAPPCKPSTTTPSPNTKTTAGSCSPPCLPGSTRTPHEPPATALGPPRPAARPRHRRRQPPRPQRRYRALARLRTPYWHGDSPVRLHALASLIAQAQQLLPQAVHDARDQELTWVQIGELLGITAATAARRYRNKP